MTCFSVEKAKIRGTCSVTRMRYTHVLIRYCFPLHTHAGARLPPSRASPHTLRLPRACTDSSTCRLCWTAYCCATDCTATCCYRCTTPAHCCSCPILRVPTRCAASCTTLPPRHLLLHAPLASRPYNMRFTYACACRLLLCRVYWCVAWHSRCFCCATHCLLPYLSAVSLGAALDYCTSCRPPVLVNHLLVRHLPLSHFLKRCSDQQTDRKLVEQ